MTKEDLLERTEYCNSKKAVVELAQEVSKKRALIFYLIQIIENKANKKTWKSAWVLEHIYMENPDLLYPHIESMIELFMTIKDDSVRRILSKLLSLYPIAETIDGNFVNICFDMLISATVAVAVKVNVIQILFNISETFPELRAELKLVIEEQIPNNTVSFKARGKRLLRKL